MFFGKAKKKSSFRYGVFGDNDFTTSFNGTVIDGVEKIDESLMLDDLCVSGKALFMGEVDADKIVIYGDAEFRDFTTCDDISIIGDAEFKREIVCESLVISGKAEILGSVSADVLIVEGGMIVNSKIKTISLNVSGELRCNDKIYADKVLVKGSLESVGCVRCIDIRFTSERKSSLERIVTDKLVAVNRSDEFNDLVLVCGEAECGVANLECAKIDYLRCERCKIGSGCVIGKLECRGKAEIAQDASVERIINIC